jgi:hypothetical protein
MAGTASEMQLAPGALGNGQRESVAAPTSWEGGEPQAAMRVRASWFAARYQDVSHLFGTDQPG